MEDQRRVLDIFRPMENGAEKKLKEYAAFVADRLGFGASYASFTVGEGAQPAISLLRVGGELGYQIFNNDGERLQEIAAKTGNCDDVSVRDFMTLWGWDLPEHKKELSIKSKKPTIELADGLAKRRGTSPVATSEFWESLRVAIAYSRDGATLPKGIRMGVLNNTFRNPQLVAPTDRRTTPYKDSFVAKRNDLNAAMPDITLGPITVRHFTVEESRRMADLGYLTSD